MPVAGIDPGTLEDRFTGLPWRGSVIAKTGTLTLRTDGGEFVSGPDASGEW